ncbi:MAG: hypothetical protein M5U29_00920 [Anaerolineae bacterium]|nr:hypothetical protein [Anaerolineae bacterium]
MRRAWLLTGVLAAALLTGCGGGDEAGQAPSATATLVTPSPLPPTWTPVPPGFVPSATPAPESTTVRTPGGAGEGGALAGGTPFPPTWTAGAPPSATPRKSPTPVTPTLPPAPTWTAHPDYCLGLTVVGGDLATRVGVAVTVRWTPIAEFSDYLVIVRHPGGGIVHSEAVAGDMLRLPGDLFSVAGAYGWEVWPLDAAGNRTCFAVGGEIIASF